MAVAEIKKRSDVDMGVVSCDGPDYPWGTALDLETEVVDALGVFGQLQVDQMVEVRGMVKVTRKSETARTEDNESPEVSRCMTLQFVKIELVTEQPAVTTTSITERLYGA